MNGDPRRKGMRTVLIAAAAAVALALAVVGGLLVGRSQPIGATSATSEATALAPRTTAPAPKATTRPAIPSPSSIRSTPPPATAEPSPEVVAITPPPAAAPAAPRQVAPAPATVPRTTAPEPTCPPDAGVVLTINSAEIVREGQVLDEMRIILTLDNRLSLPVSLAVIDLIHVVNVRSNGGEMGTGFVDLPDTYEVMPGKTTIVMQAPNAPTIYHGFGSPVTAFKLTGEVRVMNSYPDQLDRVKYCPYRDVEMGAPLQGYWGS